MKQTFFALLATAAVSQAALIDFSLSPPTTDRGPGLNPANEVPAVTNSSGYGNEISGGITFNAINRTLSFAVGYGSAAGFTNLTGAAVAAHIHGPATTGTTANVVLDLASFVFPAAEPTNGGVIFGSTILPTNAVADLLAGLYYLNIHTAENPDGEIRGQLIPLNGPPTVECPPPAVVECSGRPTTVEIRVNDPDHDPLTVVWSVNGVPIQTNQVVIPSRTNLLAATIPAPGVKVSFSAVFPLGTNLVAVSVSDDVGNATACDTSLVVLDRLPPVIVSATANPNKLWPPNHAMVDIRLDVLVKDQCGPARWKIISVRSNEPVNGTGDGNTATDWEIIGDHGLRLRAERSGNGAGRIYTVAVQAEDAANNTSALSFITVGVAKSQGK